MTMTVTAASTASTKTATLFVDNLPRDMHTSEFRRFFSQFGELESATVKFKNPPRDGSGGITFGNLGFGFVTYSSPTVAARVLELGTRTEEEGRERLQGRLVMRGTMCTLMPGKYRGNEIVVGHLPSDVKEGELFKVFQQFGTVVGCNIPLNVATNTSQGYGFVTFDCPRVAQSLLRRRDNHIGLDDYDKKIGGQVIIRGCFVGIKLAKDRVTNMINPPRKRSSPSISSLRSSVPSLSSAPSSSMDMENEDHNCYENSTGVKLSHVSSEDSTDRDRSSDNKRVRFSVSEREISSGALTEWWNEDNAEKRELLNDIDHLLANNTTTTTNIEEAYRRPHRSIEVIEIEDNDEEDEEVTMQLSVSSSSSSSLPSLSSASSSSSSLSVPVAGVASVSVSRSINKDMMVIDSNKTRKKGGNDKKNEGKNSTHVVPALPLLSVDSPPQQLRSLGLAAVMTKSSITLRLRYLGGGRTGTPPPTSTELHRHLTNRFRVSFKREPTLKCWLSSSRNDVFVVANETDSKIFLKTMKSIIFNGRKYSFQKHTAAAAAIQPACKNGTGNESNENISLLLSTSSSFASTSVTSTARALTTSHKIDDKYMALVEKHESLKVLHYDTKKQNQQLTMKIDDLKIKNKDSLSIRQHLEDEKYEILQKLDDEVTIRDQMEAIFEEEKSELANLLEQEMSKRLELEHDRKNLCIQLNATKQELAKKQEQYLSLKSNKTESNKKHNYTHIIVKKEEDSFH